MASASQQLPLLQTDAAVKFHVSLNVAGLNQSVAFYRVLLGVEPAKERPDYAKFELTNPPLVLSLKPAWSGRGGALNHLGFRVPTSEMLVEVQRRLETAGFRTARQDGVECCYARQTKFWVSDPDATLWEIYVLEEDIGHRGSAHGLSGMLAPMRALGFTEAVRRGLSKPLAALRCLWSGRCSGVAKSLPDVQTVNGPNAVPGESVEAR